MHGWVGLHEQLIMVACFKLKRLALATPIFTLDAMLWIFSCAIMIILTQNYLMQNMHNNSAHSHYTMADA